MDTDVVGQLGIYTWGANSYGQLGHGHVEDLSLPRLADDGVRQTRQTRAVRLLSGGGGHSTVVSEEGELLVCGQNHKGQLGLGHSSEVRTFKICPLIGHRVAQVSCGWDFTLILTGHGQILTCGSNAYGQLGTSEPVSHSVQPRPVQALGEPVVGVAAGLRHSLAVTGTGQVYQWGFGLSGQARRALSPQPVPEHFTSKTPRLVPGLGHVMSHWVAAGSAHCACLTVTGDVFLWGSNKHGQLTRTETFLPAPVRLDRSALDGERVTNIHSGWTHLVAQTEKRRVFTWGRANYGQLGRTEPTSQCSGGASPGATTQWTRVPSEVKVLCGATQIACGSEHNLAIVGGRLLSWGWNEHGMCGDGSENDVSQPQPVADLRPILIGCGAGHSMALCAVNGSDGEQRASVDVEMRRSALT
ncbi:secretion-regulating guanine nucleotide exchange factor isoform X2 [Esox lucius]|uniref:RCC1-like domain-containing protein n=1 Tax=Esox lucius TaxID=8010 RepID=A0AAY5L7T3_ESOLU|nr:secretion-regulating guanine nucleotide exchange factor isoform X2 [Esox lucius]